MRFLIGRKLNFGQSIKFLDHGPRIPWRSPGGENSVRTFEDDFLYSIWFFVWRLIRYNWVVIIDHAHELICPDSTCILNVPGNVCLIQGSEFWMSHDYHASDKYRYGRKMLRRHQTQDWQHIFLHPIELPYSRISSFFSNARKLNHVAL